MLPRSCAAAIIHKFHCCKNADLIARIAKRRTAALALCNAMMQLPVVRFCFDPSELFDGLCFVMPP